MGEVLRGVLILALILALFCAAGTTDYEAEVAWRRAWYRDHGVTYEAD